MRLGVVLPSWSQQAGLSRQDGAAQGARAGGNSSSHVRLNHDSTLVYYKPLRHDSHPKGKRGTFHMEHMCVARVQASVAHSRRS
jgi:hypothetical protein